MFNHSIRLLQAGGDKEKKGMMIENCHSARSRLPLLAPGGCFAEPDAAADGGPAGNTPHYDSKGELQCTPSSTDRSPVPPPPPRS